MKLSAQRMVSAPQDDVLKPVDSRINIKISSFLLGELRISLASPIRDYYGSQVQSSLSLTSDKLFEGIINFEVAQSKCAIYSKAPWVLPGPVGGMEVTSVTEDGEPPGEPPVVEMIYS